MKSGNSYAKNFAVFLLFLLFSYVLFVATIEAGTLEGKVVGASQNPKPFVRVEIYGPQSMTTFTNNEGKFSVELEGGQYRIQVIEMNQGMQFDVDVPRDNKISTEFKLAW